MALRNRISLAQCTKNLGMYVNKKISENQIINNNMVIIDKKHHANDKYIKIHHIC